MYNKTSRTLLLCLFLIVVTTPALNMGTVMAASGGSEGIWNKYLPGSTGDKKAGAPAEGQTTSPAQAPAPQTPQRSVAPEQPATSQAAPTVSPAPKSSSTWAKATGNAGLSNIGELTLYIKDTKKFLSELAPTFLNYMGDTEEILLLRLLISPEVRELKLHKGKTSDNFVAECAPANTTTLQTLISQGGTLHEFAGLFGPQTASLLARLDPALDTARSKPAGSGVQQVGSLFFAAHDNTLLLSDNLTMLETLRSKRTQQATTFNIPSGNFLWAQVETELTVESDAQKHGVTTGNWIGLNPTAWGWKYTYGNTTPGALPAVLSQMPAMSLTATELYGAESPWFMFALHGKFLALLEMLQSMEQGKAIPAFPKQGVESITLSLGGVMGEILGIPVPGITLALTGKDDVLNNIAQEFRTAAKTTWVNTSYPQWNSASVSQGATFDLPVPLPLLIAQKDGALVLGNMSAGSFSQGRQLSTFMEATVKSVQGGPVGKELAIPLAISSLYFIDMQALWQSCSAMLEPGKSARLLLDANKGVDPSLKQMVDNMRGLTPPVLSIVNWTNSPKSLDGEGYILLHRGDTTIFSKTLAQIITKMMQTH